MVFVGGSDGQIKEYFDLAQKEEVEGRCIFVKKQPFEKVVQYEMAMDALVIPYPNQPHFRDYGFPLKVWEYMAAGRPIIYSNLMIIAEVLEGKGVAFEPDDPASLATAVLNVFQNRESAEEVANRNSKDAINYTWKTRAIKIIDFINKK